MMANDLEFKNRSVRMSGPVKTSEMQLKNARIVDGLSMLTETTVEFLSTNHDLDLQKILGEMITIEIETGNGATRYFTGICISVEYVGLYQGLSHFVAELRPWLWMLKRSRDNRIFQDKSALDIITELFGDYGFSSQVNKKVSGTFPVRTYCVQFDETDFDFVCRLMEEEGIYYYHEHDNQKTTLVLADSVSAHSPLPEHASVDFFFKEDSYRRRNDHIFEWSGQTHLTSGRVTLEDYNFEAPTADQKKVKATAKGKHAHKSYEDYRYPGHVRPPTDQDNYARVRMEAEAVRHLVKRGICNVRTLAVGGTFKLEGHPRRQENADYLVIRATHLVQVDTDYEDSETTNTPFGTRVPVDPDNKDTYRCTFDVIPKAEPFRAPLQTPWPRITGMQTAEVTGPKGEEIHTDKYGRIKVQFHWDRDGKRDDKTTCWVRCVMPWTGKNWGMFSIPRIGNEVVIQFENGDPDRPICTGMIYNGDNMPPYALPDNMTQTGIVTRSTKKGGAGTFSELVFEDKKDAEFVRFQSERDYFQTIKNDATVTIGLEHKNKGDLTQTIHRNKTETLNTGDHSFTVKDGNQTVKVKKDHTGTIEGKFTQTVTGDYTETVKTGNYTQSIDTGNYKQTVKTGNSTREINTGNYTETVKLGNYTLKTNVGAISEEALQKIELKVGANSIKIDQSGITIKGIMVKIEGSAMLDAKAPMTSVKGDATLILKGGITLIN